MLVGKEEIIDLVLDQMTDRQREIYKTYCDLGGDRNAIAKKLGIRRTSVDRYLRGDGSPLINIAVKIRNMEKIDVKHHEKISPEWLESEVKQLYDIAKKKLLSTNDEKEIKYYEKMVQEYLIQLKDLEYKFQDMEKDDIVKLLGLKPNQLLELAEDVVASLKKYKKAHDWGDNGQLSGNTEQN